MTAIGATLTVLFALAAIVLPRVPAALSLLAATLYITQGQTIEAGLNLTTMRFVEIAAILRVLIRADSRHIAINNVDKWLTGFTLLIPVIYCLRIQQLDAYQIGIFVDGILCYICFRVLIRDVDELATFAKGAVLLLIPFAGLMAIEAQTGRNLFAVMGGVPETPVLRDGHYRCQASFRHAITAGSLGATFFPIYIGLLLTQRTRIAWWGGTIAAAAIVIASHSSGPLMALLVGIVSWLCWPFRTKMVWVRRGIVAGLVILQLAMSAPVWFIFDRISGIIGGDGWHRSNLIDQFIRHANEWWLAGMPIENTGTWAATHMPWGGVDVTNFYVSTGLNGGIISLIACIVFIVQMFKTVGRAATAARAKNDHAEELLLWGLGAAFCAHVINLTAVIYWDQSYVIWYLHAALASGIAGSVLKKHTRAAPIEDPHLTTNRPEFAPEPV